MRGIKQRGTIPRAKEAAIILIQEALQVFHFITDDVRKEFRN